jgi:predicted PurR-regulated permease PerM
MSKISAEALERRHILFSTVSLAVTLLLLALLVWQIARVLLVVFAAILLAILLDGLARFIERFLPLGHQVALGSGIFLVVAFLAGAVLLAGPQIGDQIFRLGDQLPQAVGRIQAMLREFSWGRALLRSPPEPSELVNGREKSLATSPGFSRPPSAWSRTV